MEAIDQIPDLLTGVAEEASSARRSIDGIRTLLEQKHAPQVVRFMDNCKEISHLIERVDSEIRVFFATTISILEALSRNLHHTSPQNTSDVLSSILDRFEKSFAHLDTILVEGRARERFFDSLVKASSSTRNFAVVFCVAGTIFGLSATTLVNKRPTSDAYLVTAAVGGLSGLLSGWLLNRLFWAEVHRLCQVLLRALANIKGTLENLAPTLQRPGHSEAARSFGENIQPQLITAIQKYREALDVYTRTRASSQPTHTSWSARAAAAVDHIISSYHLFNPS